MAKESIEAVFSRQLPSGTKRWVIGLSGGLDSMVLLALAANTLPKAQLQVVHIDHQLQPQSSAWSDFCRRQAQARGLAFKTIQVRVDPGASLERAAREARYRAFADYLQAGDCLLLAHHNGDQAETMLFRLLRGSGLRGLAGIPRQRSLGQGGLVRPLLQLSKTQLHDWARQQSLQWVEDPSNEDVTFDRNFLRQRVMPLLESRWPGFASRWGQTAEYLATASHLLDELARIDADATAGAYGALDLMRLQGLSGERQDNLLRYWLLRSTGQSVGSRVLHNIRRSVIAAGEDACPEVQLSGFVLRRFRQQLYIHNVRRGMLNWHEQCLTATGARTVAGQLLVRVSLDAGGLKTLEGVRLRNRQEGDRCRPLGRGGSCSLKKLFQENNVPPWLRDEWPIMLVGDEIVALPGICVCDGWQNDKNLPGFVLQWLPSALFDNGESGTL